MTEQDSAEEKCKPWFDRVFNRYKNNLGGINALVAKGNNEFIGQCRLLIYSVDGFEELEIGYSLMRKFRGKGYAIEAAKKCKDFAFENNLTESVISIIHIENEKSEKVALKNEMTLYKTTAYYNSKVNICRNNKSDWNNEKFSNAYR